MVMGVPTAGAAGLTVAEINGFAGVAVATAAAAVVEAAVVAAGADATVTAPDTGNTRKAITRITAHAARPLERDIFIGDDEMVSDISVMGCIGCRQQVVFIPKPGIHLPDNAWSKQYRWQVFSG
jgi:hypothetical protein